MSSLPAADADAMRVQWHRVLHEHPWRREPFHSFLKATPLPRLPPAATFDEVLDAYRHAYKARVEALFQPRFHSDWVRLGYDVSFQQACVDGYDVARLCTLLQRWFALEAMSGRFGVEWVVFYVTDIASTTSSRTLLVDVMNHLPPTLRHTIYTYVLKAMNPSADPAPDDPASDDAEDEEDEDEEEREAFRGLLASSTWNELDEFVDEMDAEESELFCRSLYPLALEARETAAYIETDLPRAFAHGVRVGSLGDHISRLIMSYATSAPTDPPTSLSPSRRVHRVLLHGARQQLAQQIERIDDIDDPDVVMAVVESMKRTLDEREQSDAKRQKK